MLVIADVVEGNSTRQDRQSAALFLAPDIHSNIILLVANSSPHLFTLLFVFFSIQELCEWFVLISNNDVCTQEIVIPFGDSIINSIGLLFSGTPLSLGIQKSVR